jgi:hypothetical protein
MQEFNRASRRIRRRAVIIGAGGRDCQAQLGPQAMAAWKHGVVHRRRQLGRAASQATAERRLERRFDAVHHDADLPKNVYLR